MDMKKNLLWIPALLLSSTIIINAPFLQVNASENNSINIEELLGDVGGKLSDALSGMDDETAGEIFEFVKEKVQDGSLESEDGIREAISEGKEKFGVDISEADARKVVETMEKLEDLGFSGEYIVDEAEELYDKYGADFVQHADEAIKGAVQNAAANAVDNFFRNLWESAKNFFKNLFAGL